MPVWKEHVYLTDVWDGYADGNLTFEQVRDTTVQQLSASLWYRRNADVRKQVDDYLANTMDVAEFDDAWSIIVDMANYDRVWLERMLREPIS